MKFTPVHCCIIWSEVPRIVRRRFDAGSKSEPEKHAAHEAYQVPVGMARASISALATISVSSVSMYCDVGGWPRTRTSASRALSSFPRLTK